METTYLIKEYFRGSEYEKNFARQTIVHVKQGTIEQVVDVYLESRKTKVISKNIYKNVATIISESEELGIITIAVIYECPDQKDKRI